MSEKPREPMRFRLRTLLIVVAIIACAFGGPAWFDYLYWVQISHLSDAEAQELRLFGATPIRELPLTEKRHPRENFTAEYRPRFVSMGRLTNAVEKSDLTDYSATYDHSFASIQVNAADTLERFFTAFQEADVLNPKTWVMRGVVVDAAGRPVPGVMVNLEGDYYQINGCQAREDGTFFHVIDFAGNPPTKTYRSRFRLRDFDGGWQYRSRSFTFTGGEQMQVRLTLPVTLDAE